MVATSTLAASCAALSSAIIQLLSDTGDYARRVRDARHDINAISAELLAIKHALDIVHDDFANNSALCPPPLLDAVSGVLECCGHANGEVHKTIITLSGSEIQRESGDAKRNDHFTRLRRKLEVLHVVLDLVLDFITIFTLPPRRSSTLPTLGPSDRLARDTTITFNLLQRIIVEKERLAIQQNEELMDLECWLAELGICAKATYDGFCLASKRSDSPVDGHEVPKCQRTVSAQSSKSTDSEIGAWIDHVASHVVLKPMERPERTCASGAPSREDVTTSQSTLYAESSTSGSIYSGNFRKYMSRPRSIRPQSLSQGKDLPKSPFFTRPTTRTRTVSMHDLLRPHINDDKVAIAKSKRADASPFQIFNLDRDLRIISRTETHATVQRLLFAGADPNVEDSEFGFMFIRAAFGLPTAILRLFVEYGADISKVGSSEYPSVLHAAVLGNRIDNLKYLVNLGLPIDTTNGSGETPLHFATKTHGAFNIAKYLLEIGADVNAVAKTTSTPLHTAIVTKNLDSRERSAMVELFLAHGAEDELNHGSGTSRGKGLSVLGII